jgi:aspartyl aminopeptidase
MYMKDARFILSEDVKDAINEFYDYSYLLKEGRQLNEFNIKDAAKKANDMITFAVNKTGNAVNDNALKIYVAATNKLTQFGSSIGAIFASPENMNKLKDGREHTFVVKNGKIQII